MYSLRKINNLYSEHAGSRSDFIIVGHPEFNYGKVKLERGFSKDWDTRRVVGLRNNIIKVPSEGALAARLTAPGPQGSLRERAERRAAGTSPRLSPASGAGSSAGFESFLAAITQREAGAAAGSSPGLAQRTAASIARKECHSSASRLFSNIHEELGVVREQLRSRPEETRRRLKEGGAWRYYAGHLEQERRVESTMRNTARSIQRSATCSGWTAAHAASSSSPHSSGTVVLSGAGRAAVAPGGAVGAIGRASA